MSCDVIRDLKRSPSLYMEEFGTFKDFHQDKTGKALTQLAARAPHGMWKTRE